MTAPEVSQHPGKSVTPMEIEAFEAGVMRSALVGTQSTGFVGGRFGTSIPRSSTHPTDGKPAPKSRMYACYVLGRG